MQRAELSTKQDAEPETTNRYTERAEKRISVECAGLNVAATSKCTNEIIEAAEQAYTSQQDLQAQQEMAKWALLMMVASGLTVIITAIGVIFVRLTLNQTVEANKAAQSAVAVTREIGEAQSRGYISSIVPENQDTGEPLPNLWFVTRDQARFLLTLENVGQSPVTITSVEVGFSVGNARAESFVSQGIDSSFRDHYMPPRSVVQKHIFIPRHNVGSTWTWALLKYNDIHESKWVFQSVTRLIPTKLPTDEQINVGAYVNTEPVPGMCVWKKDEG